MMAKFVHPVTVATAAVALSIALGVTLAWRTVSVALERAVVAAAPAVPAVEVKKHGWDFWTVEVENLASELKDERERLRKRSEELDQREARIAAAERELAKVRADIDGLRKQISDRVIEMSADEAANLRKLSQTYTNLSPRAVVAIVREMDDATAVKILALMKPDVVGPIFEEMTKTAASDGPLARRAATLSEKLRMMKALKPAAAS